MRWLFTGMIAALVACGPVPPSNQNTSSAGGSAGKSGGTVFAMKIRETGEPLPDLRLVRMIGRDAVWASADNSLRLLIKDFASVTTGTTSFDGEYFEYGVDDEPTCPQGTRRDFEGQSVRQWGNVLFEVGDNGNTLAMFLGPCGGEVGVPWYEGTRKA